MAFRFYPEVDTCNIAVPFWSRREGHWGREITVGRILVGGVHVVTIMYFVWYQKDQMLPGGGGARL